MAELIAIFRTKDVEEEIHDEKHSDDENEVEITEDSPKIVEEMRLSVLSITTLMLLIKLKMLLILNMLKNYCVYIK